MNKNSWKESVIANETQRKLANVPKNEVILAVTVVWINRMPISRMSIFYFESFMSIFQENSCDELAFTMPSGIFGVWMVFLPHSLIYFDDETSQKSKFKRFSNNFAKKVAVYKRWG